MLPILNRFTSKNFTSQKESREAMKNARNTGVLMRRTTILLLFVAFFSSSKSQTFKLDIVVQDSSEHSELSNESLHPDRRIARQALNDFVGSLYAKGFLASSIDSIIEDSITLKAYVHIGVELKWINLRTGTLPLAWDEELHLNLDRLSGQSVYPNEYQKLVRRILNFAENNGYPFAEVGLDSILFGDQHGISASLLVFPNRYFVMDTISLEGDAKVSKKFLYSYLGFHPGEPYRENAIAKMAERLRMLPFIKSEIRSKVYFSGKKVRVVLNLNERKTDQIDGIVGFAPNPIDSKLLITGEVNIDLQNLLQRGVAFDMHWKSFQQRSQVLKLGGSIPYILQKPVGLDGQFDYVKYDTLFSTIQSSLGVRYMFQGTDFVKFYFQNQSSSLLSVDTSSVRQTGKIPDRNPVDSRSYGAEVNIQKLDYILNPRKGVRIMLNANIGTRKILKDLRIENVTFLNTENKEYNVYDSIELTSIQGQVSYDFQWYLPLRKKSTVVLSAAGKHLLANQIFFNDLYRFGGTKSLRGFNEESLLTNSYTMGGLEFRYLFNNSSYFQLFANAAYTIKDIGGIKVTDIPFGFGTGVSLEVKSGLLTLAYAVGAEQGNSIRFGDARIHFGIINYL
jgi:outer membrane protein assembly factor BamA